MRNKKTFGLVSMCALTLAAVGMTVVAASDIKGKSRINASDTYTLTLDSTNGVSGTDVTTTQNVSTDSGNYQVEFSYTDVSSLDGGHCVINAGGVVVNKDHIRSVSEIKATFSGSGTLNFRTSYDGSTWGAYNAMTSDVAYTLTSCPYYIELSASNASINLTSMRYAYTCQVNQDAHEGTTGGSNTYVWTSAITSSSDYTKIVSMDSYIDSSSTTYSTTGCGKDKFIADTNNFDTEVFTLTDLSDVRFGATPYASYFMVGGSSTAGYFSFSVSNDYYVSSVVLSGQAYSSSTASALTVNDESNTMTTTLTEYTYTPNASEVTIKSVTKRTYISQISVTVTSKITVPSDETGFNADDANKLTYKDTSIFDSANGITAQATFTDGSTKALSKGTGEDNYSYTVKNSNGDVIDTSVAFGEEGVYTLTINYKSYIPVVINLSVGVDVVLESVSASMLTTSYTTADVIGNNLSGNLTANLTYNVSSYDKTGIAYSDFATYGLTVTVSNSGGVAIDQSAVFGTAGTYTLIVACGSISSSVTLTVSAIPVTNITLDQSEMSLEVGQTGQLVATVSPDTATNKTYTWASSDETVATVSDSGLVTAVKVGTATVTATSNDGTNKVGSCTVTVTKSTTTEATITCNNSSNDGSTISFTTSEVTTSNITVSAISGSNVYGTGSSSTYFRFSSGSKSGTLTITFSSVVIRGVKINAKLYGSDSSASVKVVTSANTTGASVSVTDSSAFADYTYSGFESDSAESTTLTISSASKNRFYLNSITLTTGVLEPVYPTAITLTGTSAIGIGETSQLSVGYTPSNTNQKSVTFASSNTAVATVSDAGLVTGVAEGSTTITATAETESSTVSATLDITVSKIAVTSVSVSASKSSIVIGGTSTVTATVLPTNATDRSVTWSSSNTSVATVDSTGVVTGVAAGTATITATTTDGAKTASVSIEVTEEQVDDWTILIYMCGADLESSYASSNQGLATGDLKEIASVAGQPDGVNIVVEAGGASKWQSTYSSVISTSYLNRFHLSNKSYVKDEQITKANMGLQSTFQSFLTWGLETYPAEHTAVIMWNHGGGMYGVCYDENYDDDSLSNSEVSGAVSGAMTAVGRTEKLDWIGYDACLMAVQDIAEFNSQYFNYMVCSEESESGYGWDYDTWVDDLFSLSSTTTILKAIVDGFITDQGGASSSSGDQTLSYLNLSYAAAYKTAWENMATQLTNNLTSSNKTAFCSLVNGCKYFADTDYTYFCTYDAKDFINKLAASSTLAPGATYTNAVLTAMANLVEYSVAQTGAGNAYGLAMFFVANSTYASTSYASATSVYGSTTQTNFTVWRALQKTLGYLKQ